MDKDEEEEQETQSPEKSIDFQSPEKSMDMQSHEKAMETDVSYTIKTEFKNWVPVVATQ